MSKLHEECGVFGVFSRENYDIASTVYYGLYALQHRGQQSCGIVVDDDGVFSVHRDVGLVNEVFGKKELEALGEGHIALGHVRYGSAGNGRLNAQPTVVSHGKGSLAIAHNGCITNATTLRKQLEQEGAIFHSTSDTEIIAYLITKERLTAASIEEAVSRAISKLEGAFSLAIMSPTKLIALRDPHGFHPLCYGETKDGAYVVASESCALDAVDARMVREIEPGEIVVFTQDEVKSIRDHCDEKKHAFCVFEYIYFARPDSVIDDCTVHTARLRAGAYLALEHPVQADVVIGVPDSGLDAAVGYAKQSGIPYEIGFLKNKYIGRTFIAPGQKTRENLVRIKLNPISEVVKGKRVVLIDDSIVRGTTCARIIRLLREAGATEVHMRVTAPPFLHPCYYGTDIPSRDVLIACNHTLEEIEKIIDVDSLGYLSLESAKKLACGEAGTCKYCTACFDGKYPTAIPDQNEKNRFQIKISESEGKKKE